MQYTGERKLVGIAMMHKLNSSPVFVDDDDKTGQKQATEIPHKCVETNVRVFPVYTTT